MSEQTETYQASANMKKFFQNLENLKDFVKSEWEKTGDETLKKIYEDLHKIYRPEKNG